MPAKPGPPDRADVDQLVVDAFRQSWGRVIAAAFRVTGDLEAAREAAAESFAAAVDRWPRDGVPRSVEAWLVTAARRRAVDHVRRAVVAREHRSVLVEDEALEPTSDPELDELRFLALLAGADLPREAQVLLLLRFGCGLRTEALAAMHHVPRATMAARLTRAKRRLQESVRTGGSPDGEVEPQLPVIVRAVYLIFTAGRNPASGDAAEDPDRLLHADFLAAVLDRRWPSADTAALRVLIVLAAPDPDLGTARRLFTRCTEVSPLTVQAAIMLEHATADPSWMRIAELYDTLLGLEPNATFAVGRAVALAYAFDPEVGLADLDDLATRPDLAGYRYLHAARADCLTRLDRPREAAVAYGLAAGLAANAAQRASFAARGHQ